MAMTRRGFLRSAFGAALAAPAAWVAHRVLPARWTVAVRSRTYPGPVRPLDPRAIKGPAPWAG